MSLVKFTNHARQRIRQRFRSYTIKEVEKVAVMAMSLGMVTRGTDKCKRYHFSGFVFVIDEDHRKPMVITVYRWRHAC